jgi:hypothetical protein
MCFPMAIRTHHDTPRKFHHEFFETTRVRQVAGYSFFFCAGINMVEIKCNSRSVVTADAAFGSKQLNHLIMFFDSPCL